MTVGMATYSLISATPFNTRNQKHCSATSDNAYRQDKVLSLHAVSGVNYYLNGNYRKYFGTNSTSDCLHFGKFPMQFCKSCGATYQRNYEMFSAF